MPARRPPSRRAPAGFLIVGEDSYLRSLLREEIVSARVPPEAREAAVTSYSLADTPLEEVLARALVRPLFCPCQVLVVTEADRLGEEQVARLEEYWKAPTDFTVLIFEAPALDRRTRAARLLLERCQVHTADSPADSEAVEAALDFAREAGVKMRREVAEELVFVLGTDQGRLRSELQKLASYAGRDPEVTSDAVAAVVSPARKFRVFELADLIAEGRRAEALQRLRRLLETGENPVGVVGLLAWLYRQLLQARALPAGGSAWKASEALRAPRARAETLVRRARQFRPEELRGAFAALLEADVALKSSPPDPVAVVEALLVRLTPVRVHPERAARAGR